MNLRLPILATCQCTQSIAQCPADPLPLLVTSRRRSPHTAVPLGAIGLTIHTVHAPYKHSSPGQSGPGAVLARSLPLRTGVTLRHLHSFYTHPSNTPETVSMRDDVVTPWTWRALPVFMSCSRSCARTTPGAARCTLTPSTGRQGAIPGTHSQQRQAEHLLRTTTKVSTIHTLCLSWRSSRGCRSPTWAVLSLCLQHKEAHLLRNTDQGMLRKNCPPSRLPPMAHCVRSSASRF